MRKITPWAESQPHSSMWAYRVWVLMVQRCTYSGHRLNSVIGKPITFLALSLWWKSNSQAILCYLR